MGWFDSLFGGDDRVIRQPEFAGIQYPADGTELRAAVEDQLRRAELGWAERSLRLRGVVAPYGDYEYAGPVMGTAYRLVARAGGAYERVVLLASSERVPFRGLAVAGFDGMATPMGETEIDLEAMEDAAARDMVRPIEPAFEPAAGLELQLPFLQSVEPDAAVLPVLVGDAGVSDVAAFLEVFWDRDSLLVIGANLSEGYAVGEAEELDAATVRSLEACEEAGIERGNTSARLPLKALVQRAVDSDFEIESIARTTSAATAGHEGKVVGYAALGVWE